MKPIFRIPPILRSFAVTFSVSTPHGRPQSPLRFSTISPALDSMTGRTYTNALALLESLQPNRAIVSSISGASRNMNLEAIPEMLEWTRMAGYTAEDFATRGLRCVHVAGTKGKGSVCAMVENILMQYRKQDSGVAVGRHWQQLGKIGLYTSPHLVTVRERIRIDGFPISELLFTHYFFELWDRFSQAALTTNGSHLDPLSIGNKPGYFRYLTLLALHTFMREGIETAIVECGIGGEYDSTNILPLEALTVAAIARIGIDHTGMLGSTVDKIAWHKAGIMKKGVPAYTVEQVPEAQAVLEKRAAEKGAILKVVKRLPILDDGELKLGLEGDFQKENASLAVSVAASHLQSIMIIPGLPLSHEISTGQKRLPDPFIRGLETTKWPGRCEVRKEGNIEWLIDGAHTLDSIEACARWYYSKVTEARSENNPPTATMLIFNQQDRDADSLLRKLMTVLLKHSTSRLKPTVSSPNSSPYKVRRNVINNHVFTYAAFCTNSPFKTHVSGTAVNLRVQERVAKAYEGLDGNMLHMCYGSVQEAVELARKVAEGDERLLVLVTGSLHLVGGLLRVLEEGAEAPNEVTS